MDDHINPGNYGASLKDRADEKYREANTLYREVNRENKFSRNSRCGCGSGKKWKHCCLVRHEEKTLELEQRLQEYRGICIELRKKK